MSEASKGKTVPYLSTLRLLAFFLNAGPTERDGSGNDFILPVIPVQGFQQPFWERLYFASTIGGFLGISAAGGSTGDSAVFAVIAVFSVLLVVGIVLALIGGIRLGALKKLTSTSTGA
jgi:hypothetical protein